MRTWTCPYCGSVLLASLLKCPNCGNMSSPTGLKCAYCGAGLTTVPPVNRAYCGAGLTTVPPVNRASASQVKLLAHLYDVIHMTYTLSALKLLSWQAASNRIEDMLKSMKMAG